MYTIIPQSASIALSDLPFEFAKFLECQSKAHSYAFYVYNPSAFPAPASHKKNGPDGRPDKNTNIFFKISTFYRTFPIHVFHYFLTFIENKLI